MKTIPTYSVDLIRELDKDYPLFNPKPNATIESIQRMAGRRDVVEYLLSVLKEDDEMKPKINLGGD